MFLSDTLILRLLVFQFIFIDIGHCNDEYTLHAVSDAFVKSLNIRMRGEFTYLDETIMDCTRVSTTFNTHSLVKCTWSHMYCIVKQLKYCLSRRYILKHTARKKKFNLICGKFLIDSHHSNLEMVSLSSWTFMVPQGFKMLFHMQFVDIYSYSYQCEAASVTITDVKTGNKQGPMCDSVRNCLVYINGKSATVTYKTFLAKYNSNSEVRNRIMFSIQAFHVTSDFRADYYTPSYIKGFIEEVGRTTGRRVHTIPQQFPANMELVDAALYWYFVKTIAGYHANVITGEFTNKVVAIADGHSKKSKARILKPLDLYSTTAHMFTVVILMKYIKGHNSMYDIVYYSSQLISGFIDVNISAQSSYRPNVKTLQVPTLYGSGVMIYRLLTRSHSLNITFMGTLQSDIPDASCQSGGLAVSEFRPDQTRYYETLTICSNKDIMFSHYIVTNNSLLVMFLMGDYVLNFTGIVRMTESYCWPINSYMQQPNARLKTAMYDKIYTTKLNTISYDHRVPRYKIYIPYVSVSIKPMSCVVIRSYKVWQEQTQAQSDVVTRSYNFRACNADECDRYLPKSQWKELDITTTFIDISPSDTKVEKYIHTYGGLELTFNYCISNREQYVFKLTCKYYIPKEVRFYQYDSKIYEPYFQHVIRAQNCTVTNCVKPVVLGNYTVLPLLKFTSYKHEFILQFTADSCSLRVGRFISLTITTIPGYFLYHLRFRVSKLLTNFSFVCYPVNWVRLRHNPFKLSCWEIVYQMKINLINNCLQNGNCSCDVKFTYFEPNTTNNLQDEYNIVIDANAKAVVTSISKLQHAHFEYLYFKWNSSLTWYNAEDMCLQHNGHLTSISTWWELSELMKLLKYMSLHLEVKQPVYIGLIWTKVCINFN